MLRGFPGQLTLGSHSIATYSPDQVPVDRQNGGIVAKDVITEPS